MKIVPIGERVLIKPIKKEEVTRVVFISPNQHARPKEGTVVAAGRRDDGSGLR